MIKEYIQFAIDNGFEERYLWKTQEDWFWKLDYLEIDIQLYHIDRFWDEFIDSTQNIIAAFTSKPFIKAVVKWYALILVDEHILSEWWATDVNQLDKLMEEITHKQAEAIREEELEEFITNLFKQW